MGVMLKRQVVWRAIVTPKLKEEIAREYDEAAAEIERRIQQLDFSIKGFLASQQGANIAQALEIRRQVEAEKKRQQATRDELLRRKEEFLKLEEGTEVIRGILEGWVEVEVGDNLAKALAGTEIVTKDGVVVEIREIEPETVSAPAVAGSGQESGGQQPSSAPQIIVPGKDG